MSTKTTEASIMADDGTFSASRSRSSKDEGRMSPDSKEQIFEELPISANRAVASSMRRARYDSESTQGMAPLTLKSPPRKAEAASLNIVDASCAKDDVDETVTTCTSFSSASCSSSTLETLPDQFDLRLPTLESLAELRPSWTEPSSEQCSFPSEMTDGYSSQANGSPPEAYMSELSRFSVFIPHSPTTPKPGRPPRPRRHVQLEA